MVPFPVRPSVRVRRAFSVATWLACWWENSQKLGEPRSLGFQGVFSCGNYPHRASGNFPATAQVLLCWPFQLLSLLFSYYEYLAVCVCLSVSRSLRPAVCCVLAPLPDTEELTFCAVQLLICSDWIPTSSFLHVWPETRIPKAFVLAKSSTNVFFFSLRFFAVLE